MQILLSFPYVWLELLNLWTKEVSNSCPSVLHSLVLVNVKVSSVVMKVISCDWLHSRIFYLHHLLTGTSPSGGYKSPSRPCIFITPFRVRTPEQRIIQFKPTSHYALFKFNSSWNISAQNFSINRSRGAPRMAMWACGSKREFFFPFGELIS